MNLSTTQLDGSLHWWPLGSPDSEQISLVTNYEVEKQHQPLSRSPSRNPRGKYINTCACILSLKLKSIFDAKYLLALN